MNTSFRRALLVAPTASALTLCGFTGALATELPPHAAVPAASTAAAPVSPQPTVVPAPESGTDSGPQNTHGLVADVVPGGVPSSAGQGNGGVVPGAVPDVVHAPDVVPGDPGQGTGRQGNGNGGTVPGVVPGNGAVVPDVLPGVVPGNAGQGNGGTVPGAVPVIVPDVIPAPSVVPGNSGQGNGGQGSDGAVPGNGHDGNGTRGNGGQGSDGAVPGNGHDGTKDQDNDGAVPDSGDGTRDSDGPGSDGATPGKDHDGNEDRGNVDTAAPEPSDKSKDDKDDAPVPESTDPVSGRSPSEGTTAPGWTTPVVHVAGPWTPQPVGVSDRPGTVGLAKGSGSVSETGPAALPAVAAWPGSTVLSAAAGTEMPARPAADAAVPVSVAGAPVGTPALPDSLAYTGVGTGVLGAGGLGAMLLALGAALRLRRG